MHLLGTTEKSIILHFVIIIINGYEFVINLLELDILQ